MYSFYVKMQEKGKGGALIKAVNGINTRKIDFLVRGCIQIKIQKVNKCFVSNIIGSSCNTICFDKIPLPKIKELLKGVSEIVLPIIQKAVSCQDRY